MIKFETVKIEEVPNANLTSQTASKLDLTSPDSKLKAKKVTIAEVWLILKIRIMYFKVYDLELKTKKG